jgi:redox-sensitive bicupin YhaK (pirin superfamily)
MSNPLAHAKIVLRRSSERAYAEHGGWLKTFHTFSFNSYSDNEFQNFGKLLVLNEDRVAAQSGFPTHPHRDAEIFSYILSGELTHRDSMVKKGAEGEEGKQFYRMHRGDVQFTTGGSGKFFLNRFFVVWRGQAENATGIAHSEQNESSKPVHFLQIWVLPWKYGLKPQYHTMAFSEQAKRKAFVPILSPLAAGPEASLADEDSAIPKIPDTIPIHADFVMGAGIIEPASSFKWNVGVSNIVSSQKKRNVYIHLPMTKQGKSKIKIDGREDAVLEEGDGAFITNVNAGESLRVESIGEMEAEVIVLDSN